MRNFPFKKLPPSCTFRDAATSRSYFLKTFKIPRMRKHFAYELSVFGSLNQSQTFSAMNSFFSPSVKKAHYLVVRGVINLAPIDTVPMSEPVVFRVTVSGGALINFSSPFKYLLRFRN